MCHRCSTGVRKLAQSVCDFPDCHVDAGLRTCTVEDCDQQHHHICAINAGQEDPATRCHRCLADLQAFTKKFGSPDPPAKGGHTVTQARKEYEARERAEKEKKKSQQATDKKTKKELEKELKELGKDKNPGEEDEDEDEDEEDKSLLPVFLDRNWKRVLAPVLNKLAPQTNVLAPEWESTVPGYVRSAVPGLRFVSCDGQLQFIAACRARQTEWQTTKETTKKLEPSLQTVSRVMLRALGATFFMQIPDTPKDKDGKDILPTTIEGAQDLDRAQRLRREMALEVMTLLLCVSDHAGERFAGSRMLISWKLGRVRNCLPEVLNTKIELDASEPLFYTAAEDRANVVQQANLLRWLHLVPAAAIPKQRLKASAPRTHSDNQMDPASRERLCKLQATPPNLAMRQNAYAVDCAAAVMYAWMWEQPEEVVSWRDVVDNMQFVAKDDVMASHMAERRFKRSDLVTFLRLHVGDVVFPAVEAGTSVDPTEDVEEVAARLASERLEAAAILIGDLWTLTDISQKLMPMCPNLSPSDTPLYYLKVSVDVQGALDIYRELCVETCNTTGRDLLILKIFKPAMISMAHYTLLVVDVDSEQVWFEFDSLVGEGDPEPTPIARHVKRMALTSSVVCEMRVIKGTARRFGTDIREILDGMAQQRLDWCTMLMPMAIPPVKRKQMWATCTADVCVMEAALLAAICFVPPIRLPRSLAPETYQRPRTADGKMADITHLAFVRRELLHAVVYARVTSVAGKSWPGETGDAVNGLPLTDVNTVWMSLADPATFLGVFEEQTPTQALARLCRKRALKSPQQAAEDMLAERKAAYNKAESKLAIAVEPGASRKQDVTYKKNLFLERAERGLELAISGRKELTELEWVEAIRPALTELSETELLSHIASRAVAGKKEAAKVCLLVDMTNAHPQMRTRAVLLGVKLMPGGNLKDKPTYEALPVLERPYELIPFVPGLGRHLDVAVYECSPGGSVSGNDQDETEVHYILRYQMLVPFTASMADKTWAEVVDADPAIKQPRVFTLGIFQQRDDNVNQPVRDLKTSCRRGAVQVLCAEYHPATEKKAIGKNGKYILNSDGSSLMTLEPATVEFFSERMDSLANNYWIDPLYLGSIPADRCGSPRAPSTDPFVAQPHGGNLGTA